MSLTLSFNNVYLLASGNYVGPMEYRGPLGHLFDSHSTDLYAGEKNFELAERKMTSEAINSCLKKANMTSNDIPLMIGGDLLNQTITSNFIARNYNASFVGVYSACATIASTFIQASMAIDHGVSSVLCFTSSHQNTAERQFRFPIEYGVKRKPLSTFTATGSAAFILSNKKTNIQIKRATIGRVVDYGLKDANDMGSAMAPAAFQTIQDHLKNTNTTFKDYDLIITGDLSQFGNQCLKKLLNEVNVDDCGLHLYDLNKQEVFQGGSGCACSALVLSSYLLKEMKNKTIKKLLFCPTGALLSCTSINQKESIPCTCHAIEFEVID